MEIVIAKRTKQPIFRVNGELMSSIHGLFEFTNEIFVNRSENQIFRRHFANWIDIFHIHYLISIFNKNWIVAYNEFQNLIKHLIFLGNIRNHSVVKS